MNKSTLKSLLADCRNNYLLIALGIALLCLTINSIYFLFVFFLYLYYLFKKARSVCFLLLCISVVFLLIYFFKKISLIDFKEEIKGIIIDKEKSTTYTKYLIRNGLSKVIIYDYNNEDFKIGDIINCKGVQKVVDTYFIEGDFNYKDYLKKQNISFLLQASSIKKEGFIPLIRSLRSAIINYFDRHLDSLSSSFLKALLVGEKNDLNEAFYKSLKDNGIIHLFAISGLHLSLFTEILAKMLKKNKDTYILIFLIIFNIITLFSPSILRSSIMYTLTSLNKKKDLHLSSCDICSISFLILILINPFYMYNQGFVLSYLVTYTLILTSPLTKNFSYIMQILYTSFVSSVLTLPIIINVNYSINLLTPILNCLFIFLMTYILLPITLICAFIYPLSFIYKYLVSGFSSLSLLSSSIKLDLRFAHFSSLSIFIYYVSIVLLLSIDKIRKFVGTIMLLLVLLFQSFRPMFSFSYEVDFLDLYYGESTVIFSPLSSSVIIIDTGDGSNDALTNFLKYRGVREIEAIFITHNHLDHNGELELLKSNFKVKRIIDSKEEDIVLNNISFSFLAPENISDNENNNSLVLYASIDNFKYLFMGDAEEQEELTISKIDVDVLKVGHHGSNTSSSTLFLERISPQYAIIMAGRKEMYNFPSKEVINRLNSLNIKTISTKESKSIKIKSIFSRLYFSVLER